MITSARLTIGESIVALNTAGRNVGMYLTVKNTDAVELVYIGTLEVTALAGYELGPGESITARLEPNEVLYAVSTATGIDVTVLRS